MHGCSVADFHPARNEILVVQNLIPRLSCLSRDEMDKLGEIPDAYATTGREKIFFYRGEEKRTLNRRGMFTVMNDLVFKLFIIRDMSKAVDLPGLVSCYMKVKDKKAVSLLVEVGETEVAEAYSAGHPGVFFERLVYVMQARQKDL